MQDLLEIAVSNIFDTSFTAAHCSRPIGVITE